MPTLTTITPDTTVTVDASGVTLFRVAVLVSYLLPGDLPTENIFVYKIVSKTDPKSDVFLRVAGIADLTTVTIGRDQANLIGSVNYLSPLGVTTMTTAGDASAAKSLLIARINQLILDWRTYVVALSDNSPITVPTASSDIITSRQGAYQAQKTKTAAASSKLVAANTAQATAKKTSDLAATNLADVIAAQQDCATTKSILGQGLSGETVFVQAMQSYLNNVNTTITLLAASTDATTLAQIPSMKTQAALAASALSAETQSMALLTQAQTRQSTACQTLAQEVSGLTIAKSQADLALGQANSAQTQAQQALLASQSAQAALLALVLEVCPDYQG